MVGKSQINLVLAVFLILTVQPLIFAHGDYEGTTRAFEKFNMTYLPPIDPNGNFTLDEDDQWDITGSGVLEGNITMSDQSVIIANNANITVNGTLWARDQSSLTITSSEFTFNLAFPEPVDVNKQYEGPHGFLLIDEEASFTMEDSSLYLPRHDIYVDQGDQIIPGEVLVGFGNFVLKNSYLNTNGTFDGNPSPPKGTVLHMNCEYEVINSTLTCGIKLYVNANGIIENTHLRSFSMEKNTNETIAVLRNATITNTVTIDVFSNVLFENCNVESCLIVKLNGVATLYDSNVKGLKLHGNGTVIMDNSELAEVPGISDWINTWDDSKLVLLNSSYVNTLILNDNVSISLTNSSMNMTILHKWATATLLGSNFNTLSACTNSTAWLQDSTIEKYTLNDNAKICNITSLVVNTKLNLQPGQIPINLKDTENEILASSHTTEDGTAEFTLIRDMISFNHDSSEIEYSPVVSYCYVEGDYENIHEEKGVVVDSAFMEVELNFEDYNLPSIDNVHFETDPFMGSNKKVFVSAIVKDDETNLKNVLLRYTKDNGKTWKNITLYNTGQNLFENSIPGQSDGTKVRFYIIAEDRCGNKAESQFYTYTSGEGTVLVNNLIIITAFTAIICVIAGLAIKWKTDRKKVKKYIRKTE
jgi:hypothetical protein